MTGSPDIALVAPGTTFGWRHANDALVRHVRAAGATCRVVAVPLGPAAHLRRTMATTDLVEAFAARRATRGVVAGAYVYSSFTAALLQPPRRPTAVWFDGLPSANRPGAGGAWQRRREGAVLAATDLLLPWSEQAGGGGGDRVVVPPPVATAAPADDAPDVLAYAGNPRKRGLDMLCAAWERARGGDAVMGIGGLDRDEGRRWLSKLGGSEPAGVRWLGSVERSRWLALTAGAGVFLSAAQVEDWGMAQMEALAAGTPLVCAPAPGGNAALPLARELGPDLVAPERSVQDLAAALAAALEMGSERRGQYSRRARALLEPYSDEALGRRVADELLPRLLASSS